MVAVLQRTDVRGTNIEERRGSFSRAFNESARNESAGSHEKAALNAPHERERFQLQDDLNQSITSNFAGDLGTGRMNRFVGTGSNGGTIEQKKKEEKFQDLLRRITLEQYLEALEQRIATIDVEIDQSKAEIEDLNKKFEAIQERIEALRQTIDQYDQFQKEVGATGTIKLNSKGELENKLAEEALQEYEHRTGKKIDRNDPEAVKAVIRKQIDWLEKEQEELRKKIEEEQERIRKLQEEKKGLSDEADKVKNVIKETNDPHRSIDGVIKIDQDSLKALLQSPSIPEENKPRKIEIDDLGQFEQKTEGSAYQKTAPAPISAPSF